MGYQGWSSQSYGNNVGGWNNSYCGGNNYSYCGGNNSGYGSTFVLIVVLFILLIIVGATYI